MSTTVVDVGDKLHIATRRQFEGDIRRQFVGEVTAASDSLVAVRGSTFIYQAGANEYIRLPEERTRIFSLGDSGHVVNKIPRDTKVGSVVYKVGADRTVVSDGGSFSMAINEFGSAR